MQNPEKEIQYLTRDTLIHINDLLGYSGLVREENLLGSALTAPKNAAYYEGADIVLQAATLIERLALNHPFVDGNKRTALIAGNTFLLINYWHVVYADEVEEQVYAQTIENLVAQKDFEAVVQWLQAHVQPLDDEEGDSENAATTPTALTDK